MAHQMRMDGKTFEEIKLVLKVSIDQARTYAARGQRLEKEKAEATPVRSIRDRKAQQFASRSKWFFDQMQQAKSEKLISTEVPAKIEIKKQSN
jgi:hypothetical protein